MSITIKSMEMPYSCAECKLVHDLTGYGDYECPLGVGTANLERPAACPLIELPPHGRLVDADALFESDFGGEPFKSVIRRVLMQAPTIIPADKEDE